MLSSARSFCGDGKISQQPGSEFSLSKTSSVGSVVVSRSVNNQVAKFPHLSMCQVWFHSRQKGRTAESFKGCSQEWKLIGRKVYVTMPQKEITWFFELFQELQVF